MPGLVLYHICFQKLKTLHPQERVTRLRNFSWLLVGLLHSRTVHLSRLASHLPGRTQLLSRTRQLRRLLQNRALRVRTWYAPVAGDLLAAATRTGEVRLLLDATVAGPNHRLLVVAVAFRRRALPVAWTWVRGLKGHSPRRTSLSLLAYVRRLLPTKVPVLVVGDAEFGGVALQKQLKTWGWHYVLRQQGHYVVAPPGQPAQRVDQLVRRPGQRAWVAQGLLTTKQPLRTNVLAYWKRGEERPWLLATNLSTPLKTRQAYHRRMWIEATFGDFKGQGFGLDATHLRQGPRLSRLMLAVAFLYVWCLTCGARAVKRGWRYLVDRRDRRDKSLFRIGFHIIQHRLVNALPLQISFQIWL